MRTVLELVTICAKQIYTKRSSKRLQKLMFLSRLNSNLFNLESLFLKVFYLTLFSLFIVHRFVVRNKFVHTPV